MKKIVIDIYGSDSGERVILQGVAKAMKTADFFPVLVGDEKIITEVLSGENIQSENYEILHTTDYITNDEPAAVVFGGRDESSLVMAYKKLKEDVDCVALLSAGNTGAMLVGAICRLGLLNTIKFPALCSALPCAGESLLTLVDCGAIIDCTANDFVRFAKMGNVFSKCYCKVPNPRVGIMSVGREDAKGSALTLEAFSKLKELNLNFVGNLEGSDMVSGYADVIVTDGFSGNLLLKATEAVGKKAMEIVKSLGTENPEMVEKINKKLFETFDFNSQGAATFLGTKKIVVKMHGAANIDTTISSIMQILRLEKANFSKEMANALS